MTRPGPSHPLTISDLAQRTGVPAATLRSWEARYGFPTPARLAGGHRRYAESDVDRVREVLRHRDAGLALEVAVRRISTESTRARSIYAELRRRHPSLTSQVLSKSSLVALSHAIEDECCARAEEPLIFGSFQRTEFLDASRARWVELARTARAAVVFANHATPYAEVEPGRPIEVAVPEGAALNREWAVVCDATDLRACLVAVERPGQDQSLGARRRFDAMWSVDPEVVRDASRVAASLADDYRPGWRPGALTLLEEEQSGASPDLHRASDLLNRMIGYLDLSRRPR
ncbi:MerR family transcriptional regulator [Nocardioides sp. MAH-18]|uniref:MerR family transcriptional regulator n=1 Tax=Nocardioides agri TaxID=2682843 RepID=A0A6L6XQ94_9ACTN|nr:MULTISPECIES: DICT sensory domain-containing protein [unclassified Nocardioides]MBA2953884.1 MerR family transcriptional regulator [Nocardioides sp. CGMCC 1.13656]MVQ48746.1 MerR family transcriptional regulator [Nocardioides sp. MAH-18]